MPVHVIKLVLLTSAGLSLCWILSKSWILSFYLNKCDTPETIYLISLWTLKVFLGVDGTVRSKVQEGGWG